MLNILTNKLINKAELARQVGLTKQCLYLKKNELIRNKLSDQNIEKLKEVAERLKSEL